MITEVADDVWQVTGIPRGAINAYIAGDVLVDTMTRWARRLVTGAARRHRVSMVALTHCHPDHAGSAAAVCAEFSIPLACHEADVAWMEGARIPFPRFTERHGQRFWLGPPHPVARPLREGDRVGDFRVIHAPGHTPGHVIYFRDADGVAIAGDLCSNQNPFTGRVRLADPPANVCTDQAESRRSIRRLLNLDPSLVCVGHGPPISDIDGLDRYAASLGV
ncbi:MAG: MBL fold metallo-hydrolase [Candidatus Dormiibacterota bacterium]